MSGAPVGFERVVRLRGNRELVVSVEPGEDEVWIMDTRLVVAEAEEAVKALRAAIRLIRNEQSRRLRDQERGDAR